MKLNNRNCPNCGAPLRYSVCEYCGTVFDEPEKDTVKLYANDKVIREFKKSLEEEELRNNLLKSQCHAAMMAQSQNIASSIAALNTHVLNNTFTSINNDICQSYGLRGENWIPYEEQEKEDLNLSEHIEEPSMTLLMITLILIIIVIPAIYFWFFYI